MAGFVHFGGAEGGSHALACSLHGGGNHSSCYCGRTYNISEPRLITDNVRKFLFRHL